jgi:nucleoid-associated protein YgaU
LEREGIKVLPPVPEEIRYRARSGLANTPATPGVVSDGRRKLVDRLEALNKSEPKDVCFVLIGYSTGVPVIEEALGGGAGSVSPEAGSRIVAVERFADPINLVPDRDVAPEYKDRAPDPKCNPGDLICDPDAAFLGEEHLKACQEGNVQSCSRIGNVRQHLTEQYGSAATEAAEESVCLVLGTCSTTPTGVSHTVASGDTLWDLAVATYGDGTRWQAIYEANRDAIEQAAREHGYPSSDGGNLIFPGTSLVIPPAS